MANKKAPRPNKFITFDPSTFAVLQEAASATGLTFSHIVDQLMRPHMTELMEFIDWLESQEGDARELAIENLRDYGPEDLITTMKRLDPTYQDPEARMRADMDKVDVAALFGADDMADLRTMLAEWKAKRAQGATQ